MKMKLALIINMNDSKFFVKMTWIIRDFKDHKTNLKTKSQDDSTKKKFKNEVKTMIESSFWNWEHNNTRFWPKNIVLLENKSKNESKNLLGTIGLTKN
jgi:hypothetical protein